MHVYLALALALVAAALLLALLRLREYRRALSDYRVLARHRLGNALTIILGSAETMLSYDLDARTQTLLLEQISRQAVRLGDALEPEARTPEEAHLRPLGRGRVPADLR